MFRFHHRAAAGKRGTTRRVKPGEGMRYWGLNANCKEACFLCSFVNSSLVKGTKAKACSLSAACVKSAAESWVRVISKCLKRSPPAFRTRKFPSAAGELHAVRQFNKRKVKGLPVDWSQRILKLMCEKCRSRTWTITANCSRMAVSPGGEKKLHQIFRWYVEPRLGAFLTRQIRFGYWCPGL